MSKKQIAFLVGFVVLLALVLVFIPKRDDTMTKVYVDSVATEVPVTQVEQPTPALGAGSVTLEKIVIDQTKTYTITNAICGQDVAGGKITAIYYCPKGKMADGTTAYRQLTKPVVIINGDLQ